MAITPNFRPAQHVYQSTYEPLPFKEIAPIAMQMQQEYNQGAQAWSDTSSYVEGLEVSSSEADQEAARNKLGVLRKNLESTRDNNPDFRSSEFNMGLRKIIADTKNDKFWETTAHNAKMEQEWKKAILDPNLTEAGKFELERTYNTFKQLGSEGYGKLEAPTQIKSEDWRGELEKAGHNFVRESTQTLDPETGLVTTTSGVRPTEVAALYGFETNDNLSYLKFNGIPPELLNSPYGTTLKMDARLAANKNGTSYEEELNKLYVSATSKLIPQLSGMSEDIGVDSQSTKTPNNVPGGGTFSQRGNAIEAYDKPISVQEVREGNKADLATLEGYQKELATLDPNTNPTLYKYRQQQIEDLKGDIEEREQLEKTSKAAIDYDNRSNKIALDGLFYYMDEESRKDYLSDNERDWSTDFEGFIDFNGDSKVTTSDLKENVAAINYYRDMISSKEYNPANYGLLSPYQQEMYNNGQKAYSALAKLDSKEGIDRVKEIEKVGEGLRKLDKELDTDLKSNAATIKYTNYVIGDITAGVDPGASQALNDLYTPTVAWTITDPSTGKVIKDIDDMPKTLDFKMVSSGEIPKQGYKFTGVDKDGKTWIASTKTVPEIGERLGTALMKRNNIADPKNKNASETMKGAFYDGFRMRYPGMAESVDRTINNGSRTIYDPITHKKAAVVNKVVPDNNENLTYWTITYNNDKNEPTIIGKEGRINDRNKVLALLDYIMLTPEQVQDIEKKL
jgi:hypothetical protein